MSTSHFTGGGSFLDEFDQGEEDRTQPPPSRQGHSFGDGGGGDDDDHDDSTISSHPLPSTIADNDTHQHTLDHSLAPMEESLPLEDLDQESLRKQYYYYHHHHHRRHYRHQKQKQSRRPESVATSPTTTTGPHSTAHRTRGSSTRRHASHSSSQPLGRQSSREYYAPSSRRNRNRSLDQNQRSTPTVAASIQPHEIMVISVDTRTPPPEETLDTAAATAAATTTTTAAAAAASSSLPHSAKDVTTLKAAAAAASSSAPDKKKPSTETTTSNKESKKKKEAIKQTAESKSPDGDTDNNNNKKASKPFKSAATGEEKEEEVAAPLESSKKKKRPASKKKASKKNKTLDAVVDAQPASAAAEPTSTTNQKKSKRKKTAGDKSKNKKSANRTTESKLRKPAVSKSSNKKKKTKRQKSSQASEAASPVLNQSTSGPPDAPKSLSQERIMEIQEMAMATVPESSSSLAYDGIGSSIRQRSREETVLSYVSPSATQHAPVLPIRNVILVTDKVVVMSNGGTNCVVNENMSSNHHSAFQTALKNSSENNQATILHLPSPLIESSSDSDLPRINKNLTLAQLKYEAHCRGLNERDLPKLKSDLYYFLGDGSIHLCVTEAWKQIEQLRAKIEQEADEIHQKSLDARQVEEERQKEEEFKSRVDQALHDRMHMRKQEIERQRKLHKHDFPRVHEHPLASTQKLILFGDDRDLQSTCSICKYEGACVWTCELCDFDLCQGCFNDQNMTEADKTIARENTRREREERTMIYRNLQERRRRNQEDEERQNIQKWNASRHFHSNIINPPHHNMNPDANRKQGYTVWCSHGLSANQRRGFKSEAKKKFDSTWMTKEDANARARYLFFWCNCWGIDPEEIEDACCKESEREGLKSFGVEPPECGFWRVSVVPDVAFLHLQGATLDRHTYTDCSDLPDSRKSILRLAAF